MSLGAVQQATGRRVNCRRLQVRDAGGASRQQIYPFPQAGKAAGETAGLARKYCSFMTD